MASSLSSIDVILIAQIILGLMLVGVVFRLVGKLIGGIDVFYGAMPWHAWLLLGGLVAIALGHLMMGPENLTLSLQRTAMWLVYLVIGFIMFLSFRQMAMSDVSKTMIFVVAGSSTIYVLYATSVFLISGPPSGPLCESKIPIFTNIRHTGYLCAPALALSVFVASVGQTRTVLRVLATLMAVILWSYLEYTGSRGAVFAVVAAALASIVIFPIAVTLRLFVAGVFTFVIAMLLMLAVPPAECGSFGLFSRMQNTIETGQVTNGRLDIWLTTWELIAARPLFGYGEIHLSDVSDLTIAQPHNIVLQALLTWGFVGAALFFALITEFTLRGMALARRRAQYAGPVFLALLSMLAYSVIDGALYLSFSLFVAMLLTAASAALLWRPSSHPDA